MSSTSALANLLAIVAQEVRGRILQDRALGITDPNEETHTQNLLSRIAQMGAADGLTVVAREVPKTVESRLLGADIALWVMGGNGVTALHMQCKRLFPDDTYRDLGHENTHGRQVELLVNGAADVGAGASYMFYNGLRDDQPRQSACCLLDFSPDRNGIALAPAVKIKPFVGKPNKSLNRTDVEGLCTPIVCLARCCAETAPNLEDDPAEVLRSWYEVQTGNRLTEVDVSDVPDYARPLFNDLAAAMGRIPWPFADDEEGDLELDDVESDFRFDVPAQSRNNEADGFAIAIAIAHRRG